jgi:hypothetical protein
LDFQLAEATEARFDRPFDYILLPDLINAHPDIQTLFEHLLSGAHPRTRLILTFTNELWSPILRLAELTGFRKPQPLQNCLSVADVQNLLNLAGWEVIRTEGRILWPFPTPLWARFCNRFLAPCFGRLGLAQLVVARPRPSPGLQPNLRCAVIIPARNERANIAPAIQRVPELGAGTELVFIEGHSTDGTWEEIQNQIAANPHRRIRALKQTSRGKGPAVREAFATTNADVLFILDADLTVSPEDLSKFYALVACGAAEFVNGVRLIYPKGDGAMRFANLLGNKFFGVALSWLLGQPVRDTLCGTKVFLRTDYERIAAERHLFGELDPFGDFDLLFGAARLNLRIVDLPVHYHARAYGRSQIRRWRDGWLLLRMLRTAALRLKFG